jgi:hypothetical protein
MRSAFWRGVALLKESEGDGPRLGQGPTAGPSNTSAHAEGISEVPRDVALIKPAIDKLMDKVIPIMI